MEIMEITLNMKSYDTSIVPCIQCNRCTQICLDALETSNNEEQTCENWTYFVGNSTPSQEWFAALGSFNLQQ